MPEPQLVTIAADDQLRAELVHPERSNRARLHAFVLDFCPRSSPASGSDFL